MKHFTAEEGEKAIACLIDCIQFQTVSNLGPFNGSYDVCAQYLLEKLTDCGFDAKILPESVPHKPIVVATLLGTNPSLPGVLLNSHYDVVPALIDHWTEGPFMGRRVNGRIYGRGTQDMKSVCVQYFVALNKLVKMGYKPLRNIFVAYVPDEEIGGVEGMQVLISSPWFSSIKIGIALDEGLANVDNSFSVFYGERLPWWVKFKAVGNTGHASRFIESTAVEQIVGVANKALAFRKDQSNLLHEGQADSCACSHLIAKKKLGDVTSLNLTVLRAGVQAGGEDVYNVIPMHAEAGFDIRISPHTPPEEIIDMLDGWCRECTATDPSLPRNGGLSYEILNNASRKHAVTSIEDSNPWWKLFSSSVAQLTGATINAEVFPAATDSRFLRALGVRAFGFSPLRNSEILLHEHDENIKEDVFLEGCDLYVDLIQILSSRSEQDDDAM